MAFTTHDCHPLIPAAPPPTPSNNPRPSASSSSFDAFSSFLQLSSSLPLSLSLPVSFNPSPALLPTISLCENNSNLTQEIVVAAQDRGFFQLVDHNVSAETAHETHLHYTTALLCENHSISNSNEWPLGLDEEDEEDEKEEGRNRSLCFYGTSADGLRKEFLAKLGSIGCIVMKAMGFEKYARGDDGPSHLVWISSEMTVSKPVSGRSYPCIISLQYQIHDRTCFLRSGSGWVSVAPEKDAILVTIGDIAKVWSNGRFSNVIGRPVLKSTSTESHCCYPLTMLMTWLPSVEKTIFPLPDFDANNGDDEDEKLKRRKFVPFSFQEYAYRIYNQRFFLKDPLARYAVKNMK